jgi:hypothetical protein
VRVREAVHTITPVSFGGDECEACSLARSAYILAYDAHIHICVYVSMYVFFLGPLL